MNTEMKILDKKQQGIVLFVALIALVIMSLAAVALIRSVDTNTQIAGNLSFRQSALVSSDRGLETALSWINSTAVADVSALNMDSVSNGYFATYVSLDLDDPMILRDDDTWDDNSAMATGDGISGGTESASGNSIRYIVQRMCREAVAPSKDKCLLASGEVGNGSKGDKDYSSAGAIVSGAESAIYRITVRVTGPRNTVSYAQAFVY